MSTTLTETPATTCEWCGKPNTERLPQCVGCGTRLVSEPPPSPHEKRKGKDRMTAVCFALIFGPLGLIYINAWGILLILLVIRGYFFATHSLNLWAAIAIRFASAGFAYGLFDKQSATEDTGSQATELLDKAARLEGVDRAQAIAAYREVVKLYPNTTASSEATRNIKILIRQG